MNKQPEALRLADELAIQDQCDFYKVCEEAALELRWLHEENERLRDAVAAEREACAKENAELLQALQNLHQRCHWADAPEEMDAAKAAIEKAIRARGER